MAYVLTKDALEELFGLGESGVGRLALRNEIEKRSYESSIPTPTRQTGRIFLTDDFEATTIKWRNSAGTTTRVTTNYFPFHGNACLDIASPAVADNENETYRRINLLSNMKIGFELWFLTPVFTNIKRIQFSLDLETDTITYQAEVRYLFDSEKWLYVDENANWNDFPNDPSYTWNRFAHQHIKFIVDLDNGKYKSFSIGNRIWDLSNINCRTNGGTGPAPSWFPSVIIEPSTNAVVHIYIDDVILTNFEE